MADQASRRRRQAAESAPSVSEDVRSAAGVGQTPPPTTVDAAASGPAQPTPRSDEDTSDRVKVTRADLLRHSEQWLGVPAHVAIGALHENPKEEMTLGAARNAVERYQKKATTVEEG